MTKAKRARTCCLRPTVIVLLVLFGLIMISLGIVLRPVIDQIFREKIDENLVLGPDTPVYKPWHKSDVPIHGKYYFFNIANPEEVEKGAKPFVIEKGPYAYKAYTEKVNITWDTKNALVSYDEITWYVNDGNSSCSSCNSFTDEITTVNVPLLVVNEMLKNYPDTLHWKRAVSALLEAYSEKLFITRTVHDLLWGYQDPLLVEIAKLREELPFLKSFIPEVKTTVLLQPNNTLQGKTTIHTGAKDIQKVQKWKSWKGKDHEDIWLTKYANMLNGSDGRQFAPRVSKSDRIYFMVIQLCRPFYISYDHELQFRNIDLYRFTVPQELFLNGSVNANNAAFYPQGILPTGILDPRKCQEVGNMTAPIFLSGPHFYLGDQRLVDAVDGVKPCKAQHELSFDIEPNLGVPLRNAIRLQINAFIEPVKDISETSGVRKVYMPIMWFDESADIDSDTTDVFHDDIILPMKICHFVEIAMICIGGFLLIMEFIVICCLVRKKRKTMLCCCRSADTVPLIDA